MNRNRNDIGMTYDPRKFVGNISCIFSGYKELLIALRKKQNSLNLVKDLVTILEPALIQANY